jgi:LysR family hydrogen peroxide-inducible transcriptional activator
MSFRPSLRQLEYVVALAECGHFGKAAKQCHVSQPTLSVQVGIVEDSLGVQLFERTSTTVLLTPVGERFLHGARVALAAVNDLLDSVAKHSAALGGVIRLGTPPTFGPYFLPTFLPPLHEKYPDLKIYITEDRPAAIETAVAEGTLDCGLGPFFGEHSLTFVPIGRERLFLGVPANHPLAKKRSVVVEELGGERLLVLGSGHQLLESVQQLANASRATVIDDYVGTSLDAIRQMVSIGMGCSLFPELYARAEFRNAEDVHLLELENWSETRQIGICFRATTGRVEHFQEIAERAADAASKLGIG